MSTGQRKKSLGQAVKHIFKTLLIITSLQDSEANAKPFTVYTRIGFGKLGFERKCPHFWTTELLKETRVGVEAGGVQNGVLSLVEPKEENNL
jgi:hypothetical protein